MKIAFFTEGYDPFINGVVTALKVLHVELERRGHEVVIFAPAYPGYEDCQEGIVRLPSVKWSKVFYPILSPLARGRDVLEGGDFDLIHSHHPFTMSHSAARLARQHGLPLVYTFHTMLTEQSNYLPLFRAAGKRWLTSTFLRHCEEADRITTPTAIIRDFLHEQGVTTPIDVVPAGVPDLQPASDGRERVRRALCVPDEVPLLLYAGRLSREKQLDFLLRSVARLRSAQDFRLGLVGGGLMEKDLRDLAAGLDIADRVVFCGWVPHAQMADYYAAAEAFVFPSTSDTMGVVLVEAMNVGLPCVAVDRYGPRDVVMDGTTGFLVPFDERSFADAVLRLLQDEPMRRRMSEAAKQRARDYEPAVVGEKLCNVYETVSGSASASPWGFRGGGRQCSPLRGSGV